MRNYNVVVEPYTNDPMTKGSILAVPGTEREKMAQKYSTVKFLFLAIFILPAPEGWIE